MTRASTVSPGEWALRPVRNSDQAAIVALIDAVFSEYGEQICLADADRDLLQLEESYAGRGGAFVVLESTAAVPGDSEVGAVWGTHAVLPLPHRAGRCTFRRLYLHPALRGTGAGQSLMRWAIETAEAMGFHHVGFWSDTRFKRAHRFFRQFDFRHDGRTREMRDAFEPYREYYFERELGPRKLN